MKRLPVIEAIIASALCSSTANTQSPMPDERKIVDRMLLQLQSAKHPDDVLVKGYLRDTSARVDVVTRNIIIKLNNFGRRLNGKWAVTLSQCAGNSLLFHISDGVMTMKTEYNNETTTNNFAEAMMATYGGREIAGLRFGEGREMRGPVYVDRNMSLTSERGEVSYFGNFGFYANGGTGFLIGGDGRLHVYGGAAPRVLVRCRA